MSFTQISVADHGAVRIITLQRPERLNAWTPTMKGELVQAFRSGNDDPSVGAFVVTGAGRGFCAGADVSEVFAAQLGTDGTDAGDTTESGGATAHGGEDPAADDTDWVALVRASKPMVAAINGPAVGVGLSMVLSMDFLVAHPEAKLSARFVKMGVVPELASSHFLVQRCGFGNASDLVLSGRTVLGDEALALGLVDEVSADVVDAAIARADSYAVNAPPSLRFSKQLLTENATESDLASVQRRELRLLRDAYATDEHREAIAAFLEKRPPRFR